MTALVEASAVCAGYGAKQVLRDLNLEVCRGEVVALLGPNGAGKTTTLLTLAGELRPLSGALRWNGDSKEQPLSVRARRGLAWVNEGRSVFTRLTTRQNLEIARGCEIDKAVALFPELAHLMSRRAGLLSGGEQQMLALARSLARPTKLLLADELSLGLAPQAVGRLLSAVRSAANDGMGALLVEQHVSRVLDVADRVYVLRLGQVVFAGTATEARSRIDEIKSHYLTHDMDELVASGGHAQQLPAHEGNTR